MTPYPITVYKLTLGDSCQFVQAPSPESAVYFWALNSLHPLGVVAMAHCQSTHAPDAPTLQPLRDFRHGMTEVQVAHELDALEEELVHCDMVYPCELCEIRYSHDKGKLCEPCRVRAKIREQVESLKVARTKYQSGEHGGFVWMVWIAPSNLVLTKWTIQWAWSYGGTCAEGIETINANSSEAHDVFLHHVGRHTAQGQLIVSGDNE